MICNEVSCDFKMNKFLAKIKNDAYLQIAYASGLAIIIAYFSEFILGLKPCMLCIYQRIPYIALIITSLLTLRFATVKNKIFYLVIIILLIEILLAGYHVGVEHYIFEESNVCQVNGDISNYLSAGIASNCSQVTFRFMNLSMAEWNLLYSMGMLYWFIRMEKKNGKAAG